MNSESQKDTHCFQEWMVLFQSEDIFEIEKVKEATSVSGKTLSGKKSSK